MGNPPQNQIHNILIGKESLLDVRSFRAADCDPDHYLVVAKVMKRVAVNQQRSHGLHLVSFNLEKLKEVDGKKQ
jgi:hypothetical protein